MSHPSESLPTRHGPHAALASVAALLALYFLAPVVFLAPLRIAVVERVISTETAARVGDPAFAPVRWLHQFSKPYERICYAELDLFYQCFPRYQPEPPGI
jgi:hypothetical protein